MKIKIKKYKEFLLEFFQYDNTLVEKTPQTIEELIQASIVRYGSIGNTQQQSKFMDYLDIYNNRYQPVKF
jgi:hypothetical protein